MPPPLAINKLTLLFAFKYPWPTLALTLLGAFVLLKFTIKFTRFFLGTFIFSGTSLKKFGAKKGAWALITGATDGIGREFALQLAKAGFNILLVSRNPEKLGVVAAEIEETYKVQTKTHAIDFASPTEESYKALSETISSLDIGVLVNNVGKSHALPTYFAEMDLAETNDIIRINIDATLRITHIVIPGMIQRKKGLILNIGSFAGLIPTPLLSPYSASKSFLTSLSTSLSSELRPHNIHVYLLNTFYVTSSMSKIKHSSVLVPTPKTYVRAALGKIGLSGGAVGRGGGVEGTPYWAHSVVDFLIGCVGVGAFVGYSKSTNLEIRKKALRRIEREKEKALKKD